MPIWVRCILMLWVVTLVSIMFLRFWAYSDEAIERIARKDYPPIVRVSGILIVFSVLSIIPAFAWLLFFR